MDEQVARDVVLVRAIETADVKGEILSDDDRMYASRSARELAQWQGSGRKDAGAGVRGGIWSRRREPNWRG